LSQFGKVKGAGGNRRILHDRFLQCSGFSDSNVFVNHGFENELGAEECFHTFTNFFVEVLGLRFILHLLSTHIDNLRGRPPAIEFEAFVLDRGIWSGVVVEALVGVVVGKTLQ
jgi:hypothetical protein